VKIRVQTPPQSLVDHRHLDARTAISNSVNYRHISLITPASSRPETPPFRPSSSGGGVACATFGKYDSAQPLAFLELIEKLLVSTSGTT